MERQPRASRTTPIAPQLLKEHLRQGAAAREASIALFISVVCACCVVTTLCFGPLIGWRHAGSIAGVVACFGLYYTWVYRHLRGTEPSPTLLWLNVGLESSLVGILFLMDAYHADPELALGNPILIIGAGAIVLSALRADPRLPLFAATITALELLVLYAFVAYPRLATPVPLMLSPPVILLRAFYFLVVGFLARLIVRQFRGMAEEALRAIRQQELMGRYFLHERLGVGGMAEVFRATYSPEGGIEKTVAVKRILPAYAEDPQFITLFRREAELGSLLQHPNIVQVLDVGRLEDTHFMAMEYVDGLSLRQLLKESGPLPVAAVTYLGAELAAALDYVHRRTSRDGVPLNLIHRDINPPNILLSRIGDVQLSDFGIARAVTHASVTRLGHIRGKTDYMAPEQLMAGPLDGRVDLFALGLTLHEALTGQRVLHGFEEGSRSAILTFIQELRPPSALRPEVPPEVDAVVMSLLQVRPEDRPQRGNDLEDLLRALPGPVAPYPYGQSALAHAIRDVLARRTGGVRPPLPPNAAPLPSESTPSWDSTTYIRPGRGS
ncbi:serine/threonine-protein kinase [Pyxidicoccus xibeiensis]|uniref:serine/threonine-protein kinase n=1 Tax=Pyxidicoccus xibeiensis TaxID=2906759 RepID=UPI0020A83189|nr:serine/threonine-protein kinase [Pyxidicoccus xibeiensis]MCP3143196.1 serine/threonine protein kinase [Pyxidicoccus xibeiensis]